MSFHPSDVSIQIDQLPVELGDPAYGDAASSSTLSSILSSVKSVQVRSGTDFNSFLALVQMAIKAEKGSTLVFAQQSTSASVSTLAKAFGTVKSLTQQAGATQTADAITSAASWFYYNVEKPATTAAASSASPTPSASTALAVFQDEDVAEAPSSGIPMAVYVAGGLTVVGLGALGFLYRNEIKKAVGF